MSLDHLAALMQRVTPSRDEKARYELAKAICSLADAVSSRNAEDILSDMDSAEDAINRARRLLDQREATVRADGAPF